VSSFLSEIPSKLTELRKPHSGHLEAKIEYDDGTGHQEHIEKREFEFFGVNEFAFSSMPRARSLPGPTPRTTIRCWPPMSPMRTGREDVLRQGRGGERRIRNGLQREDLLQFIKSIYNYMVSLG